MCFLPSISTITITAAAVFKANNVVVSVCSVHYVQIV